MADARKWLEAHRAELVGLAGPDAAALVAAAGLQARSAAPGEALTLDFRPARVTLLTDAEGRIRDARAG